MITKTNSEIIKEIDPLARWSENHEEDFEKALDLARADERFKIKLEIERVSYSKGFQAGKEENQKKIDDLVNKLEDVVNELDLSELASDKHGPLATPPAELVRLVLEQKNMQIRMLNQGFKQINPEELAEENESLQCPRCGTMHYNKEDLGYCSTICAQKAMGGVD
jgi:rubrerythrin